MATDGPKPSALFIPERMEALGVNNAELARRVNVDRATVGKWLDDQDKLPVRTLVRIADALGLNFRDLFLPPRRRSLDGLIEGSRDAIVDLATDIVSRMASEERRH